MKQIGAFLLLIGLTIAGSTQLQAQGISQQDPREAKRSIETQQKMLRRANKKQRKAQKKIQKAERKQIKQANRRHSHR
jgi:hypothetical protein